MITNIDSELLYVRLVYYLSKWEQLSFENNLVSLPGHSKFHLPTLVFSDIF